MGVGQGGLAVVHVRDDGHVPDVGLLVHTFSHLVYCEVHHLETFSILYDKYIKVLGSQVRFDKLQVVRLGEVINRPSVVKPGGEDQQQVVQEHRLVVQVELDSSVVHLYVGNLSNDVLKMPLPPSLCRVRHHGKHCVVVLLVLVVQEDQLSPEVRLLCSSQHLWNVDTGPEQLQVLLELVWLVARVEDGKLGEHAHVSPFKTQGSLQ